VDIFRGKGGDIHDFALHGEGDSLFLQGLDLQPVSEFPGCDYAYSDLVDVKKGLPIHDYRAQWQWSDGITLHCHFPIQSDLEVFQTLSPGNRTRDMSGRKIHSLFARRRGIDIRSAFIGVYEPTGKVPKIVSVQRVMDTDDMAWGIVIKVTCPSSIDYILTSYQDLSPFREPFADGSVVIPWKSRFGVVTVKDGNIINEEWVTEAMEGLRHDI
jgi:hypothetical protein